MDTGADVSVVPYYNYSSYERDPDFTLTAANGSSIATYGRRVLELQLGLPRLFRYHFILANVTVPIIGADFLHKFGLLPDIKNRKLIDNDTKTYVNAILAVNCRIPSPKLYVINNEYGLILKDYPSLVTPPDFNVKVKHNITHRIYTTGPLPYSKPRRLPYERLELAKSEFQYMLDVGICRHSQSSTSSPLMLAVKKDTTDIRPCGDYRKLNSITIPDRYPMQHIHDFNSKIHGCKIFSKIDIVRAYHHIPVADEDIYKTAVTTPFGLFEFQRMPFGLKNASQTFQRFMNKVCENLDFVFVYLDDVLVFSIDEKSHKKHLRILFERLEKFGLKIKPTKCLLGVTQLEFLGHDITESGIKPTQERITVINQFECPNTVKKLQRFIGMINYYHRFIPKLAKILIPLHNLIANCTKSKRKNAQPFQWNDDCQKAFEVAKLALAKSTLLVHPKKRKCKLSLTTDASQGAIGSVLQQFQNGNWQPLGFFSKKLQPNEVKYSTLDRELLAIYLSIKHFRYFVEGRHFTIYTDQKSLIHLMTSNSEKSPRQINQLNYISQFTTDIQYIVGSNNRVADCLSRLNDVDQINEIDYCKKTSTQSDMNPLCSFNIDVLYNSHFNLRTIIDLQKNDEEIPKLLHKRRSQSKYILQQIRLDFENDTIWCETSTKVNRPFVSQPLRFEIFQTFHSLNHSGVKATRKLINHRYFWPGMNANIAKWTKECQACQKTKIVRHNKAVIEKFNMTNSRFDHIHIDLVGPLPPSNNYTHILTVVDRYTRWPEAYPISNITAEGVAKTLVIQYVSRFGIPSTITTDRGSQFESDFFAQWCKLLGVNRTRTTAYHPQANGMVERFHRQLKNSIVARCNTRHWSEELPIILLGIRNTIKEDLQCSPAELVYGQSLVLPGECTIKNCVTDNQHDFIERLKQYFTDIKQVPTDTSSSRKGQLNYELPNLNNCTHVLVRTDKVKAPLKFSYEGPYEVIRRTRKFYVVRINDKNNSVSVDRLKPYHGL